MRHRFIRMLFARLPITLWFLTAFVSLVGLPASGVYAQSNDLQLEEKSTEEPAITTDNLPQAIGRTKAERLDSYFEDLKRESDPAAAKRIADRIWAAWRDSGSATADQLMEWADDAIEDQRLFTALDLLDQVTVLMPDYAEGWNRRATLHYHMSNHAKSMSDINRVLELEPRHFGALMGMGAILQTAGHDEAALNAYMKVLEVYPAMRNAQEKVSDLSDELTGEET